MQVCCTRHNVGGTRGGRRSTAYRPSQSADVGCFDDLTFKKSVTQAREASFVRFNALFRSFSMQNVTINVFVSLHVQSNIYREERVLCLTVQVCLVHAIVSVYDPARCLGPEASTTSSSKSNFAMDTCGRNHFA